MATVRDSINLGQSYQINFILRQQETDERNLALRLSTKKEILSVSSQPTVR